ncbi:hypothetical protein SAMN04515671_4204 [Nakamurella panacisegetis]|uniref:Sucrase/ferredoxin-like n=1 Tax=Nakamurella panacisegetis TaxID=1090615 RepID=A0A1H0SN64_9ACTN|nr:sucrase ferredoxin [Nakamurella panacisegetis]SDP43194.1 hypothetical protein SAMN04515671_4204 [Nakamurella panacisegetis]
MTTSLCSQAARDSGDDPAGSAAEFSSFLLLDRREPWSATAAEDAVAALEPATAIAVAQRPGLRAFAIRSVHPRRAGSRQDYLGAAGPDGFLAPLTHWPVPADITGLEAHRATDTGTPMFAVCTNGKRDRCCAIVGRGVAVDLHERHGDAVVEISHLGGHRYAGTMLVLPWAYAYGFLDPAAAAAVADAAREGLVHPGGLRGRADLSPVAQAAEVLLRREMVPAGPDAVRIRSVSHLERETVEVRAEVRGDAVTLRMVRHPGPKIGETLCGGKPFATGRWDRV